MRRPPCWWRHGGNLMSDQVLSFDIGQPRGNAMLTHMDIVAGAVATLHGDQLKNDPLVSGHNWPTDGVIGMRPFLCIRSVNGCSEWLELTKQWSRHRLCIDSWKNPGSGQWNTLKSYVNDARRVISGPDDSFISASQKEIPYLAPGRPSICALGVRAVLDKVASY